MKIYIKVAVAFFALFFGTVALMEYFSFQQKEKPFQLLDQVEESELAFHADISKFFNEFDRYSKENEISLTNRVLTSQVRQQLLKSGLSLKETYVTYSIYGQQIVSFYAAINDTALFESNFIRFSKYFELEPSNEYFNYYYSQTTDLSVEKHPKYVKINWGKGAVNEKPSKEIKASPLFKSLLQSKGSGVINTTGNSSLDSNDYATFNYGYEKDFSLLINWKVSKNHPLQLGKKSISIYPSQENKVQAYSNIDLEKLQQYSNSFLKQKGMAHIEKLPSAAQELLKLWNGQASLQMGGKTTKETIQYITEFDDDFNQTERKIVKTDSLPDLGFYWGTNQPKKSFEALLRMPNVKIKKDQLQLALFPPLKVKQGKSSLKIAVTNIDFEKEKNKYIVFVNSESKLIQGELTIQKFSRDVVQLKLTIKDPAIPEKLTLSSFW